MDFVPAAGGGTPDDSSVTSAKIVDGAIVNVDVNASAAIAYSKLALSGSVVNADVNASAAIAYSKLALTGSIANGDLAATAASVSDTESAIFALTASSYSKMLAYATDTGVLFRSDGSNWKPVAWRGDQPAASLLGLASDSPKRWTTNTVAITSGTDFLQGIFIPRGYVVSNIVFRTGTTAATLGSNNDSHWYCLIRSQSGALLASTADQGTGAIASATNFTKALARDSSNAAAATWTSPASDIYLVGINVYQGTGGSPATPTLAGPTSLAASALNSIGKIFAATGQTLMTSGTPGTSTSISNSGNLAGFMVT